METRYKIILSHAMTEKEIRLDNKEKQIRIGTEADCSIRLSKKEIPAALKLTMRRFPDGWEISCPESMVLEQSDGSRWTSKMLSHGEMLTVKDAGSGTGIINVRLVPPVVHFPLLTDMIALTPDSKLKSISI